MLPDSTIARQLVDKIYEKRKAAALDLEKSYLRVSCNGISVDSLADRFGNVTCKATNVV